MKKFIQIILAAMLIVGPAWGSRGSRPSSSHPRVNSSRPYYGGGHHTTSHGGNYVGERNSQHKGGHYVNPRSHNQYGVHKPR